MIPQGAQERNILAREHYPASSIAIGDSKHGAIQQEHARPVRAVGSLTMTKPAGE